MSAAGVRGCMIAVISAFDTGSQFVGILIEKTGKKKKKKESDIEAVVERKFLLRALVESSDQCRKAFADRRQRFGQAFDVGDDTATSALKDVILNLQSQVTSALQIACARDNVTLDTTGLHEATLSNRNDALRAMDDLCRRIMGSTSPPPTGRFGGSRENLSSGYASPSAQYTDPRMYRTSSSDSSHSLPLGSAGSPDHHSQPSNFRRMQSPRTGPESGSRRPISPSVQGAVFGWTSSGPRRRKNSTLRDTSFRDEAENEDEDEGTGSVETLSHEQFGRLALHDSAVASEASSRRKPSVSLASTAASEDRRNPSCSEQSIPEDEHDLSTYRDIKASHAASTILAKSRRTPKEDDDLTPDSSETTSVSSRTAYALEPLPETTADIVRAIQAPEVVTKGYEPMLSRRMRNSLHAKRPSGDLLHIHPAYRGQYKENAQNSPEHDVFGPEPENIWSPLSRPARHNNYHGFCKGAWQTRKAVNEGLAICMIPQGDKSVPHWACKLCEFKSSSKSLNPAVLPEQVYFHGKTTIRYRWLFLAKSHINATSAFKRPESYSYGCIFCAAEGRATAIHEKLDNLMAHILSKHKTSMMTVETRERTRCVVGGIADRAEDWDINLPETRKSTAGGAVGDFMVSAVTGLTKYGGGGTTAL